MKITKTIQTDVLVIGAGGSGLRAALAAAEAGSQVIVTNKGPVSKSGITLTAAGGMQAPFHPDDSAEQYFQDTVTYGYGLGDKNLARALADDACGRTLDLERYGTPFIRDSGGNFSLSQFPGQSRYRNLWIKGGGIGLVSSLLAACKKNSNILIVDDFFVTGLVKSSSSGEIRVVGAVGLNLRNGEFTLINAKAVVMATGGCQWLWEINDCPTDATGDGLVYAYRAGAELVDMEMVLFYPTVIVWPLSLKGAFVHYEYLSKAMLEGNVYDKDGKAVLPNPLPVRDEAMRLMAKAISEGQGSAHGGLLWYVGDSPKGPEVIKSTLNSAQYSYIKAHGIDPATEKIEVAPGAHYLLGGIHISEECQTTLKGLFATPECAGNFDGANRLAGNGLTATQVFGARAGFYAHKWAVNNQQYVEADPISLEEEMWRVGHKIGTCKDAGVGITEIRQQLRAAMQLYAGVNRDAEGLKQLEMVTCEVREKLAHERASNVTIYNQHLVDILQLEIMCEVASLIAGSALLRQESRGHHFRIDFPRQDDSNWLRHTLAVRTQQGPRFGTKPVI